jgi:hypothetical protein
MATKTKSKAARKAPAKSKPVAPKKTAAPKVVVEQYIFPAGTKVTVHNQAEESPLDATKAPFTAPVAKATVAKDGSFGVDLPAGQYVAIGEVEREVPQGLETAKVSSYEHVQFAVS